MTSSLTLLVVGVDTHKFGQTVGAFALDKILTVVVDNGWVAAPDATLVVEQLYSVVSTMAEDKK